MEWKLRFPMARVYHIASSVSDHCLISVRQNGDSIRQKREKKIFRFESMWIRDPRCEEIVREAWEEGLQVGDSFELNKCLEACRAALTDWNNNEFGHVGKQLAKA